MYIVLLRTQWLHMDDEDSQHVPQELQELGDNDDVICLTCEETPKSYLTARRESSRHDEAVHLLKSELEWLKILLKSILASERSHLVAHRGFHNPRDRSDRVHWRIHSVLMKQPGTSGTRGSLYLECCVICQHSLTSHTHRTHGIHLCECDIALTKDEKLVLAHDEDFSRLALDPLQPNSSVKVRDLTFRQLNPATVMLPRPWRACFSSTHS